MKTDPNVKNSRAYLQKQYNSARSNLLLMIILTLVNILLFAAGSESMMLFSATIPYYAVGIGAVRESRVLLLVGIIFAAVTLVLYLLCWIFSKKRYGWMIPALIFFIIDTVVLGLLMLLVQELSGILDVLIHAWVLYYLIIGVRSGSKLSHLPAEETAFAEPCQPESAAPAVNSAPLRTAEPDDTARAFLEGDYVGHHICYRKVRRTNELVVDGHVYDQVEMLLESVHSLNAVIDGHAISAGYDGACSFLTIDGQQVDRRIRVV